MPEQTDKTAAAEPQGERSGGHPKIVALLIGLATIFAVVAIFSIWANRQALNTDNWVDTSGRVLQNPEVRTQLSNYLADQLTANVALEADLNKSLPPLLKPLAGPAAGALQQLAPQIAERALETAQAQELWAQANRTAHEALLELLDGGGETVSTEGGEVSLDLGAVLAKVGGGLGVGGAIAAKVPPEAAQLTILRSDQISTAQSVAKVIRRLPIVLTLLAILLYGLAIYLAGPRRRQALRSAGLGFVAAGVLALLLRDISGGYVVGALSKTEAAKPAVEAVWEIGTSLLVSVASSAIAFGVIVFLGAWLAGPTKLASSLRREASGFMREQPAGYWAAVLALYIALIAWAPVVAFRKPIGMLLFLLLLGAGAEVLRRQTLREFPAGSAASGPGLRQRVSGAFGSGGGHDDAAPSQVEQLERLGALRRAGDLSDAEFDAAKARILSAAKTS